MKQFDLEQLKKTNPELHNLVMKGRIIRELIPGVDLFTKNFPITGTAEKNLFQDAAAGFIASAAFDAITESFKPKKKIKK